MRQLRHLNWTFRFAEVKRRDDAAAGNGRPQRSRNGWNPAQRVDQHNKVARKHAPPNLSEGWGSKTRNPLRQEPAFAISPQLPRQRLRSILICDWLNEEFHDGRMPASGPVGDD